MTEEYSIDEWLEFHREQCERTSKKNQYDLIEYIRECMINTNVLVGETEAAYTNLYLSLLSFTNEQKRSQTSSFLERIVTEMLNAIKLLQEARNSFDDIIVDLTDVNNGVTDSSVQLRYTQKFALYERK